MAKTNTIPNLQNINNPDGQIANGTGTSKVTVFTAGANDSELRSLGCSSTDTSDRDIYVYINVGGAGTDRLVATIQVPLSSGNSNSVPAVDILNAIASATGKYMIPNLCVDGYGNRIWFLKASTTIKVALTTGSVTAGKTIDFYGGGADF